MDRSRLKAPGAVLAGMLMTVLLAQPGYSASGDPIFVATYDYGGLDVAVASAMAPDGSAVYVTGWSRLEGTSRIVTGAHDVADGALLWTTVDSEGGDQPTGLVVSPDGSTLFVVGDHRGDDDGSARDLITISYDTSTGQELWRKVYDGRNHREFSKCIAVAPDGGAVVVAATSFGRQLAGPDAGADIVTVAYDSSTGARSWVALLRGDESRSHYAGGCAMGPDGTAVYVTGTSQSYTGRGDGARTTAYSADTGDMLWTQTYRNAGGLAITVSPDGAEVYVAGTFYLRRSRALGTIAYTAATGREKWSSSYERRSSAAAPAAITASFDGKLLFVLGSGGEALTLLAYRIRTGDLAWSRSHVTEDWVESNDIAVTPDGGAVIVATRWDDDAAAISYDAATGATRWKDRLQGGTYESVVTAADGSTVIVSGGLWGERRSNFLVAGYEA